MQHKIILPFLLTSVLFSFIFISQCTSPEQSQQKQQKASTQSEATTPELAEYMSTMHYYTHKFALAVDAEHQELAQFYFHEIRALSDEIKKIYRVMKVTILPVSWVYLWIRSSSLSKMP